MRSVGFGEEHIQAIPSWYTSDVFSPAERAVLAYTDELVLQGGRVQDDTFDQLRKHLSEEEIIELTYITLTYELHATMCRALRLEYDDVPERIVEIAAPDEAANRDVLAGVGRPDGS
jgi:alkylhydroperoxidase family enzyme